MPSDEFVRLIVGAAIIGVVGSFVGLAFYGVVDYVIHALWGEGWLHGDPYLAHYMQPKLAVVTITTAGGLVVGLGWWIVKTYSEPPDEHIEPEDGRLRMKQTPSIVFVSLLSIPFGGSAGPEVPLVQTNGSLGGWLARKLDLSDSSIRAFTFCGMATAFGVIFKAPIGGMLFALEAAYPGIIKRFNVILPGLISALFGAIILGITRGYELPLYPVEQVPAISSGILLKGLGLGIIGGIAAIIFIMIYTGLGMIIEKLNPNRFILALLGGLSLGLLAIVFPLDFPTTPLFWGKYQTQDLITNHEVFVSTYGWWQAAKLLLLLWLAKTVSIAVTMQSGFRGGIIYPLFFAGASLGLAVSVLSQGVISPAVGMLCMIAAVNTGVIKTPVGTAVVLMEISQASLLPVLALATTVSYLVTRNFNWPENDDDPGYLVQLN
jgi:H+/Cl- antiporter ClcA